MPRHHHPLTPTGPGTIAGAPPTNTHTTMHQENRLIAADGLPHLIIPAYAIRPVTVASKRTATVLDDARVLKRTMPGIHKDIAIHYRDQAIAYRSACRTMARVNREQAIADYGAAPGLNSTPVSGGTCDHWPRQVQDLVVAYVRAGGCWLHIALAWHRYAGKHASTFHRLID
jgi:hypothetical protein